MALNIDTYFRAMSNNTPETMTMSIDWYKTLSDEEMKNKKIGMVDFNIRTCPKKKKQIKFSQKNIGKYVWRRQTNEEWRHEIIQKESM